MLSSKCCKVNLFFLFLFPIFIEGYLNNHYLHSNQNVFSLDNENVTNAEDDNHLFTFSNWCTYMCCLLVLFSRLLWRENVASAINYNRFMQNRGKEKLFFLLKQVLTVHLTICQSGPLGFLLQVGSYSLFLTSRTWVVLQMVERIKAHPYFASFMCEIK